MTDNEIRPEDFAEWDWDAVFFAGALVLHELRDIAFHNVTPGEAWEPFAENGDVLGLISEVRVHVDRLDAVLKKAKADIAGVERNARLASRRRIKAAENTEENA